MSVAVDAPSFRTRYVGGCVVRYTSITVAAQRTSRRTCQTRSPARNSARGESVWCHTALPSVPSVKHTATLTRRRSRNNRRSADGRRRRCSSSTSRWTALRLGVRPFQGLIVHSFRVELMSVGWSLAVLSDKHTDELGGVFFIRGHDDVADDVIRQPAVECQVGRHNLRGRPRAPILLQHQRQERYFQGAYSDLPEDGGKDPNSRRTTRTPT